MSSLIIGATGFIGSHLLRKMSDSKRDVYVSLRESSNTWRINDCNYSPVYLDLQNYHILKNQLKEIAPRQIFHLGAYGVYPTQQDLSMMFKSNYLSTLNLIRVCKELSIDSFVYCGSAFEYGYVDRSIGENCPIAPQDPYSLSKAAASQLVLSEGQYNRKNFNVIRPFLAFGPTESSTRLIPTLISAYLSGRSPQLSSPDNVRDFIFVEDVVNAILALSKSDFCGEVFNVGSGTQRSVQDIDFAVRNLLQTQLRATWNVGAKRAFEPKHWCADISKAKEKLNWYPKYSLENGLEETISWFKKNQTH